MARLVEEAQESKAPTERFIDRFSRYYTPAVVVVAEGLATSSARTTLTVDGVLRPVGGCGSGMSPISRPCQGAQGRHLP